MLDVPRLGSGIPVVARGRELDRLRAAFERAAAGRATAILLAGDAGVGKTRMTEELTSMAEDKGALVLTGRCLDVGEAAPPSLPFAEAFAGLSDRTRAAAHPAVATLFPDSAVPARPDPALFALALPSGEYRREQDVSQLQLFDGVYGLLGDLAGHTPVVLVLEDLHWADGSTRRLLSFLLARLRGQKLLVVGTYRGDDLHRRHPLRSLVAELVRLPAVERLELRPFDGPDARRFVAALAEDQLPDTVLRELADRSDGNAFFAEELVATYLECGTGIPATLLDVLLARVERLSEAGKQVIRVASVAGRRMPHRRIRAVSEQAGMADLALEEALREAVQHHILTPGDGEVYSFRHALVREAVYGDLLPGERVRLHAAFARVFDGEQGTRRGCAASLAHHCMESHQLPQALAASVVAADEATTLGAPAEVLDHLERALNLWQVVPEGERPAGVRESTLLRHASWAAGTSGEPERAVAYARSALALAEDCDDPEVVAEAGRRLAKALYAIDGKEAEAGEVIRAAWAAIEDRPASYVKAWVLATYAGIERRADRFDEARRWARRAVAVAGEADAPGAEADALTTLAAVDEADGKVEEGRRLLLTAIDLSTSVEALTTELRARHYLGVNRYDQGLLSEAAAVIDEGVARAKSTGLTWSGFGLELRVLQVIVRYASGDWDGAEAAGEPPGHRVSTTVSGRVGSVGAMVMVGRGRFAEAARLAAEIRSVWQREVLIAMTMGGVGAELACWQGRPEEGIASVREALGQARKGPAQWLLGGIRLGALGTAAAADAVARATQRHDTEAAGKALADGLELAEHARLTAAHGRPRSGVLGPEGRAWLARAEAEASRLRGPGDPALWQAAVDAFGYGAVYEQAVCRRRLAEALLAAGRRDEAASHVVLADEVAERLGARPLREALRKLARQARITLSGGAVERDRVDPFTPRERAVLGLVALGRTNRQAGGELFISDKTVSVHLSRVMAKLGATNRAEAVAIAYERGLLDQPAP
jgi:DNA-binding CsgD family transcriptional regulator/tetratricopeptide (TPR) repeat protein